MPRFTMVTTHRLGREEAQRRLAEKLSTLRDSYRRQMSDVRDAWSENTFSFGFKAMGMKVAGTLVVGDDDVRLAAQVPFAAVVLKSLVERRIRAELGHLLS